MEMMMMTLIGILCRWMRGKDCVTTYLNLRYPRLVSTYTGMLGGGMLPRVSSSTANDDRDRSIDRNRYPCFALQVTCDPAEYDIVLEPDRSLALFKNEQLLMRCIETMLVGMIEQHTSSDKRMDLMRSLRDASNLTHGRVNSMISASQDMTNDASGKVACNLFHEYSCMSNDEQQSIPIAVKPFAVGSSSLSPNTIDGPLSIAVQSTGKPTSDRLFACAFFESGSVSTESFKLTFSPNFRSPLDQSQRRLSTDHSSCRDRSHYFEDSPYSPHFQRSSFIHATTDLSDSLCEGVFDESGGSCSSLGRMITAVADRHAKPQLGLVSNKRKVYGDDCRGRGQSRVKKSRSETRASHQSEYAVYVRRVPLLIDIALEHTPICDDGRAYTPIKDDDHDDGVYFDTRGDKDDGDDGDYRSYRISDDEYRYSQPSDSNRCEPFQTVDPHDDPSVVDSIKSSSLLPSLAVPVVGPRRTLSDDFQRGTGGGEYINRLPAPSLPEDASAISASDREMKLNGACLRDRMEAIGQADLKYIIARSCNGCPSVTERPSSDQCSNSSSTVCSLCNNASFLIALDQHAVDERIRYERSLNLLADRHRNALLRAFPVSIPLTLSARELDIAANRRPLLDSWLYHYRVVLGGTAGAVVLEQVPEVLGVPLLQDDFRDFLLLISSNEELPDQLLKPPAVLRVLASKACRGAIMFGDLLDEARCRDLVSDLMRCDLPFNCAHGRPSMVPLVDLRPLRAYKLEECRVHRSHRRNRLALVR